MRDDLRLEGVGRRYGVRGPWVLRGIDLTLASGTLTRVEGANGTGKSTLLRLLARIEAPTEGRITGRPRTAYVPERFPAALPFTASGYLTHLGAVQGLSRTAAAGAAAEWLERLGAAAYARTPMAELSKGSSQKVAVAQALLAEPDLLVLDEAWTGLDTAARAELERAVAERTAAGGAVVFVDHDPRRLAGAPDATYAVVDGTLNLRTPYRTSAAPSGPHVVVEAVGPPDAEPPAGAVGPSTSVERTTAGTTRFTTPESHSDVLLRSLLGARPPWHVVAVARAGRPRGATDDDKRGTAAPSAAADSLPSAPGAAVSESSAPRSVSGALVSESSAPRLVPGALVSESSVPRSASGVPVSESSVSRSVSGVPVSESSAPRSVSGVPVSDSPAPPPASQLPSPRERAPQPEGPRR
jgi:ABC-type Mn2+/Zn2+ transport system ATPase subunit